MNNKNPTPFWGKVKPIPYYFKNGVVRFNVKDGKLYYTVKRIEKQGNYVVFTSEVVNKERLNGILQVESFNDRRLIEVVQQ